MKVFAIILFCSLLGYMGWLVVKSNADARSDRNKLELLQRELASERASGSPGTQSTPDVAERDLIAGREQALLQEMASRGQGAGASSPGAIPPPIGRPATTRPTAGYAPAGTAAGSVPGTISLPPGMNPTDVAPPPLTPRQRTIAAAPILAKVTEYQKEFGFVVINAGTKRKLEKDMTFAIRRGSAIIGRIKVTEVTDEGSVADLPVDSVPTGVTIEVGDDVIQDMPPEA